MLAILGIVADVAPHAGAWIETSQRPPPWARTPVAPCAGAWIETTRGTQSSRLTPWSRPVRARGLKPEQRARVDEGVPVAPRASTWIETTCTNTRLSTRAGRIPRGRLDKIQIWREVLVLSSIL